jgi:hypothetical protein
MKKSIFALAALLAFGVAQAEYIGSSNSNGNGVVSGSFAKAGSAGNGLSISAAGNSQTASSTSESSATKYNLVLGALKGGTATASGTTSGTTLSAAGNLSVGNATGSAGAGGVSVADSSGRSYFDMHGTAPEGEARGKSLSVAESGVMVGRNGAGAAGGANVGAYGALANSTYTWKWNGSSNTATTAAGATNGSVSNSGAIGNAVAGTNVFGSGSAAANAASGNVVAN